MMTDAEYFERNPDLQYRTRMAMSDEIAALIGAGLREPHSELYCYAVAKWDSERLDVVCFNDPTVPTKTLLASDGLARFVFEGDCCDIFPIGTPPAVESHAPGGDAPTEG